MALDYAFINVLCRELNARLALSRVDKIYMPSRDEVVFSLRTQEKNEKLFISAKGGTSRLHLTEEEFDNPPVPANFCMLLRKYLGRGRIDGFRAISGERVVMIDFTAVAETGELMGMTLSCELMGRYSNIVLVRDGVVIDALKRITPDKSEVRMLLPGVDFTLPPPQDKLSIADSGAGELACAVLEAGGPLSGAVLRAISGISPVVCREISFRTVGAADSDTAALTQAEVEGLARVIAEVKAATAEAPRLNAVFNGGKPVDFSFIELTQYGGSEFKFYESPSRLLSDYYGERDAEERQRNRSRDLIKQANKLYERTLHKHEARLGDQRSTGAADEKRLYGELLTANCHLIERGAESVRVLNYYSGQEVEIPLDRRLSPNANAQKYYKEYRKLCTAQRKLEELLRQDEEELAYLSSVIYAAGRAATEAEFDAIRAELKTAGYLKNFKEKDTRRRPKKECFLEYTVSGGLRVICGRNNVQNEMITFKTADKRDLWFHTKNYSGSHTVLLLSGKAATAAAIRDAAIIAACNSAAGAGAAVGVDYTEIKNVHKQAGAKPGMVNYLNFKTEIVDADQNLLERYKKRA